ncbi:MAG: tetratricopeptide repeat protein [bacterium]|nr:tetratricopeptide repeat protein [bacterium]
MEHKEKELEKRIDFFVSHKAFKKIDECCEELIRLNPKKGYLIKIETHIKLRDYKKALLTSNKILEHNERDKDGLFLKIDTLNYLLEELLRKPCLSENLLEYKREFLKISEFALTHYPKDTQIVSSIAEGYELLGKDGVAIDLLERYLEKRPKDVHILYQLGLIYQRIGEFKKAIHYFDKSLEDIKEYSSLFQKSFTHLISESKEQLLKLLKESRADRK